MSKALGTAGLLAVTLWTLVVIGINVALVYAAFHFIAKYW